MPSIEIEVKTNGLDEAIEKAKELHDIVEKTYLKIEAINKFKSAKLAMLHENEKVLSR